MIRRPPRSTLFPSRRSSDLKEESVMRGLVYRTGWAHLAAGAGLAGLLSAPGLALGQSLKEEIVGAWRIVAIYNEAGRVKMPFYGAKPGGAAVFDPSGLVNSFLSTPE